MLHFTIDDTQPAPVDGCQKCCCEIMQLKPGSIEKVSVNYAPWAVPIGRLYCSPQFILEQMQTCPTPAGADLPPRPADRVSFTTPTGMTLDGDLNTQVTDPEGATLIYKWLFQYGPAHGKLTLSASGQFTYVPDSMYTGSDRFFASASDGVNAPVIFEVILGVGVIADDIPATPHVSVDPQSVAVNDRLALLTFPVKVSPAAQLCEVWRLAVMQNALDCECVCYSRTDCFDIRIVKC